MSVKNTYRFLIADDDAINRRLMQSILQQFASGVDTAANGEEVLLAVAENDYDLIFMDVHMPVMTGIEAMRVMKTALPAHRLPMVLALTGSSDEETIGHCLEAGMAGYLVKPVDAGTIRLWLENWEKSRGVELSDADKLLNMNRVRELKELEGSASTEAVIADLIALFKSECPIQIAELKSALKSCDFERAGFLSHKLKGSLMNLGLHAAADVCARIEQLTAADGHTEFLLLTERLEELYTRSYNEFSQYLRSA